MFSIFSYTIFYLYIILFIYLLFKCNSLTEGALRVDANVSITDSDQLGTRTEIKNLGSVHGVQMAVDYEIHRQLNMVKNGKEIINETRGWDSVTKKTMSMRDKEILQVI